MSQALKVGIFGVIALVVLGYLILQVEQWSPFAPEGVRYQASFDTVAGLDDKASVRIAGVVVGRVDGVGLGDDGRALVTLLMERPVELRQGASARIANLGILGDKFVLLDAGPPGAAVLPPGSVMPGESPVSFDDALAKLNGLAGSLEESFASFGGGGQESSIRRLLDSLETTSNEIGLLVADNRSQISDTVGHFAEVSATLSRELPRLADQMERVLGEIEGVIGDNRGDLQATMTQVREATDGIRVSIDNLNEISGRLARGEGTVGKLLTSEETHDTLLSTMGTIESGVKELSDTLGRVRQLKLDLGFDSYWLDELSEARTSFSVKLDPQKSDRTYHLALVDDPRGRVKINSEVTEVTLPDGSKETTTVRRVNTEEKSTFDAQFGFGFAEAGRLRAGLFQSTAGIGVDWQPIDRFSLSLEAYDFGREEDLDPHLRLIGRWKVHPNFFLQGGYDDFLEGDRDSFFFGGGLSWSDDDLKYLLGSVPVGSF